MLLKRTIRTILFSNEPYRFILIALILITYGILGKRASVPKPIQFTSVRGVIATLIRSDNQSIILAINMIHSVLEFHSSNTNYSYPFIIFHDQNFTPSMREQILSCVLKSHKHAKISFESVDFQTSVQRAPKSRGDKSIGYRIMCRFWTYDIFYHPAIRQNGYEYLMRMDDDSYFYDNVQDLFLYTQKKELDYIYRSTYTESSTAMDSILGRYITPTRDRMLCIYNNFFVMRLKWFYENKRVQNFVNDLVADNLMLREYIGDGCVHSAMLKIDANVKSERTMTIPYGHNSHLMPANRFGYFFNRKVDFKKELGKSCDYLVVVQGQDSVMRKKLF